LASAGHRCRPVENPFRFASIKRIAHVLCKPNRHESDAKCAAPIGKALDPALALMTIKREVLTLVAAGLMNKQVAAEIGIAELPAVDGLSIPEELARREARLAKLAEARAKIEARAKERSAPEMAKHRAKLAARESGTGPRLRPRRSKLPQACQRLARLMRELAASW
jgi:FixJ family two-component response regulator